MNVNEKIAEKAIESFTNWKCKVIKVGGSYHIKVPFELLEIGAISVGDELEIKLVDIKEKTESLKAEPKKPSPNKGLVVPPAGIRTSDTVISRHLEISKSQLPINSSVTTKKRNLKVI